MKRKLMALLLGATMLMGSVLPVGATDNSVSSNSAVSGNSTEAHILSLNITKLVVPTDLQVVFNPEGWTVHVGGANTETTEQVISTNYGILNKSSKAKKFDVKFTVEDLNAVDGEDKIEFVATEAEATSAEDDGLYVFLQAVPATVDDGAVDKNTTAAQLADLAAGDIETVSANAVTLNSKSGTLGFVLDKSVYVLANDIHAGNVSSNTVNATLDSVSANSCYAFTLSGKMNTKADWSQLNRGIKVSVAYDVEDAAYDATIGLQTGPSFASTSVGVITITNGDTISSIKSVTAPWNGSPLDITSHCTLNSEKTAINVTSQILAGWAGKSENPTATITYETTAGAEKTATVTIKAF